MISCNVPLPHYKSLPILSNIILPEGEGSNPAYSPGSPLLFLHPNMPLICMLLNEWEKKSCFVHVYHLITEK